MFRLLTILVVAGLFTPAAKAALGGDPFSVSATVETGDQGVAIRLNIEVPANHFLYADEFRVSAREGLLLIPRSLPEPVVVYDKFSEEDKRVYKETFTALYQPGPTDLSQIHLVVEYQGCDDSVCFFPQTKTFALSLRGADVKEAQSPVDSVEATSDGTGRWRTQLEQFEITAQAAGYLGKRDFLAFLDQGQAGQNGNVGAGNLLERKGLLLTIMLLLLGGLALNLTPCVLPLIPINLAILGAGAQARTRGQGFALGSVYGAAMALVYGALGLVVVLTGSKFGALNASPSFNAAIAIVFVVLSLAMFDLVSIDFSRFQGRVGTGPKTGGARYVLAFSMGMVAALLAGACVAPVVISTLLLATTLYAQGFTFALLLPFLLGVGMGLPWPFAGAGLSFLPKPGKWMNAVKYAFGVLILAFAAYYGYLAYDLYRIQNSQARTAAGGGDPAVHSTRVFEQAMAQALKEKRPIFIDFWATWCKNCHAMEATTFKDEDVRRRFEHFIVVKYQAELPNRAPARDVLDHFGAIGLPTYVVLTPRP